jgi:hypothetical protein
MVIASAGCGTAGVLNAQQHKNHSFNRKVDDIRLSQNGRKLRLF